VVGLTRRALLARGAAGLMLAGCGGSGPTPGLSDAASDAGLLMDAVAGEVGSARTYRDLASGLSGDGRRLVLRLAADEERHAEALRSAARELGADPGGRGDVLVLEPGSGLSEAISFEASAAAAHLQRLPRVRTPQLRTLMAYILAEEVAHAAALRAELGREPVAGAFL